MNTGKISLGEITFDIARAELKRGAELLAVSQRGIALLYALHRADGQAVGKPMLMEAGWPGQIVEEGNLTVQIAALRKALGPMPDGNDWIVTVPRVGYRLIVPQAPPQMKHETPKPSLAVLPFVNLSGDPTQDYFADGVVEDIITALSRFKSFAVIARNSSFTYKGQSVDVRQVGHDLGVRYVLEGSIRRAGDRLRIAAQLVECDNGQHIWAEHFDGQIEDVFDFQDRITESVAMQVEPMIQRIEIERSRRERASSIAAYDLYLQASQKVLEMTFGSHEDADSLICRALELEPQNALFMAFAASIPLHQSIMGWRLLGPEDRQYCADLVRRALQDSAQDATVMTLCGDVLLQVVRDYDWAIAVIQSAVLANPNNYMAVMHAGVANLLCGSIAEAQSQFHRAIKLSPHDPHACVSLTGLANCHIILGDFEQALKWATRSLTQSPNYVFSYWMLIAANAHLGRINEARRFLAQYRALAPEITIERIRAGQPDRDPTRLAPILEGLRLAGLPEE